MHKHVRLVLVVVSLSALLFVPSLADKLFAFFFIGLVPYTHYSVPAPLMLALYTGLLVLGLYGIGRQFMTAANPTQRDTKARERARKKILRSAQTKPKASTTQTKKHYMAATEH